MRATTWSPGDVIVCSESWHGTTYFSVPVRGFDTQDHELDLWVAADGTWQWKDEAELHDWVRRGRFTEAEVQAIRDEGKRVLAEWPFPTGWEDWEPDPSWRVPELSDA